MKRLIITEDEKSRILGMHKNAISKEYLMEAEDYTFSITLTLLFEIDTNTKQKKYRPVVRFSGSALGVRGDARLSMKKVKYFKINGFPLYPSKQQEQNNTISGNFRVDDEKILNYLKSNIGKTFNGLIGPITQDGDYSECTTIYTVNEQQLQPTTKTPTVPKNK